MKTKRITALEEDVAEQEELLGEADVEFEKVSLQLPEVEQENQRLVQIIQELRAAKEKYR